MTKQEFATITAIVVERWPFSESLAQSAYVARLWEAVGSLEFAKVRDAIELLAAQTYRGRIRPVPLEIAESVRAAVAPTGTYVRHPEPEPDERAKASDSIRRWIQDRFGGTDTANDHTERVVEAMRDYSNRKDKRT